jgi:small subunit ribosomal protein S2
VADVSIAELLEAGVHFGHQTRRWNPKMRRFIYGERGGIYIIDLLKTSALLAQAQEFASTLAHRGGTVLFVGTKKQARDTVRDVAQAAGMPYVNHRWLGGLLTNFETISQRIRRLHDLERFEAEGQLELLPTRERMAAQADLVKLRANLGGVKDMQRVPDAMFVIDLKTEVIAVKEAQRLRIPIMGLVDTNCDPDGIDFVIPGNDDAIRSCALITQAIGQVVAEGHSVFRAEEERARQEAEERARIEAEARAKREAEEQAKREAEEQAKREAEEQAAREAAARAAAAAPAEQPAASEPVAQPAPVPAAAPAPTEAEAPVAEGAAAAQAPANTVEATPAASEETPQASEAPAPATSEVAETAEERPAEPPKAEEPPAAEQKAEESAPAQEPNAEQRATAEEPTNGAEPAAAESSEASDVDGSPQVAESETVEQTTETGAK